MKKFVLLFTAIAAVAFGAKAQGGVFNHLGADVSVGTLGLSFDLSTPITDYMQLRGGVSYMPDFSFNANVHGTVDVTNGAITKEEPFDMQVKGGLGRVQGEAVVNVYPFGKKNSFFVAAGLYFGGKSIIKLDGHSDRVAQLQQDGTLKDGWIEIGNYKVNFEPNGNIRGALVTNKVRPYLALGYGRPCPGKRVGFMIEAGVQFMGKMKVCQGENLEPIDISVLNNDDDWQKYINKLTVYPVLKLTLSGRLF